MLERREVLSATFGSALSIGGTSSDAALDIAVDGGGNSYVTGYFGGTVDFDLSRTHVGDADILTARGVNDAFVAKYAPDDSLVWVRRMGGDNTTYSITDVGRSISVDAGGNIFVLGEFFDSADFGNTTYTSDGTRNAFIAKIDSAGSIAWTRPIASQLGTNSSGVSVDSLGNAYAMTLTGTIGYSVLKFNATGASVWTKSFTTNNSYMGDLEVNKSGDVFATGQFWGSVDFDPSSKVKVVSSQTNASFVLKLDTHGKFRWVSSFSGTGQAWAQTITLDPSGYVVVGGYYSGTVDFNPGTTKTTLDPMGGGFVAKLNNQGALVWARALTNTGSGAAILTYGLAADASGNIYATGSFRDSIDLNPGAGSATRTSAGTAMSTW